MRSYPAFSSLVGEKLSLHHGTHSPKVCGYLHAPRGVMEATELILDRTLPRPFPGRGGDMWFEAFSKCRSNDFSREERAAVDALEDACLEPIDVDALFFTTVTGVAAPTIDVRLANRLHLRSDLKRLPFFGLGCVGGVSGLARLYDYLRAWPDHVGILL